MTDPSTEEVQINLLRSRLEHLQQENQALHKENNDLKLAMSAITQHGDLIEAELFQANARLASEVVERQRAEAMLQMLLDIIRREYDDLKIIVETLMEHGDAVDAQWQQKLNEANNLALVDGLTQIANRRSFDHHLSQQWRRMARDQLPLAIVLADIDFFKQYNDALGHLAGDECLRQVAETLNQLVSRPEDLVARYGGEEFAVILPRTDLAGAFCVAERIQTEMTQLNLPHPSSTIAPHVTLSIGVASWVPSLQTSPANLVDEADHLLYWAKKQGRNQIAHTHWN